MAPRRVLVIGFAVTGQAVCRAVLRRGGSVVVVDDHPSMAVRREADLLGVDLLEAPARADLDALLTGVDAVVPSPGVPDRHPVFDAASAAGVQVLSEFDLARSWDRRPIVAITGTDGKTTVTTMVTEMLTASGSTAVAAGNTELPLVDAIDDPATDVFVVEASSFRLGHSRRFEPTVATWLNFAPDHLDVHASLEAYEAAKARLWATLPEGATVVANADDPVVLAHVPTDLPPGARVVTFGLGADREPTAAPPGYRVEGRSLVTDAGVVLVTLDELPRSLPHDRANALAASATALAAGASLDAVRSVLRSFRGLPHRVSLVGEWDGVRWYDDSKATAPHATLAAVSGFDSVVLVAGGRNKGLDLAALVSAADRIKAVVAIGEATDALEHAFAGVRPVRAVTSDMDDAVRAAAELAVPGDTVLLSPGCASFDWFTSYAERGDVFVDAVHRIVAGAA